MIQKVFYSSLWGAAATVGIVQPVWAQTVQEIEVRLELAPNGLSLVLQTSESLSLQPTIAQLNNSQVIEIPNARLATNAALRQENPIAGIAAIEVTEINSGVRITITGTTLAPEVTLTPQPQGLNVVAVPSQVEGLEPVPLPSNNAIRIIVTGERDTYRVSESSVGTRTDTAILDVPQSIQIIPEQVIEDQGARSLGETARNTAGVSTGRISSGSLATEFVIRGFATENILRNGLRDTTQQFATGISNVDRLEILRGPASVLFGQGSLGGTVNIVTKEPLDRPTYSLDYTMGQFDLHRPSLDFSSPFDSDSSTGYRLNLTYERSGSFREFEESNFLFVAPTVTLIDTENTSLIADFEYLKSQSWGTAPELPASGTVVNNPNGEIDLNVNLGEPSLSESQSDLRRIGYRFEQRFGENWRLRNEFLAAFSNVTTNSGVIPVQLEANQRLLRRVLTENPSNTDSYTLNTNLVGEFETGDIAHQLLLGVELFRDSLRDQINIIGLNSIDIFNPVYAGQAGTLLERQDTRTSRNAIGFYLQDQVSFSDSLILLLGGRFDIANLEYENLLRATDNFERQDTAFSPRVGLVFKPADNLSLYASYTRSFEPVVGREQLFDPDTNTTRFGDPFEPERGVQYEIGLKADFNEQLSATLALYQLERSNVTTTTPDSSFSAVQVGKQRSRGVEVSLTGEILPGWNLLASYAYTDARITEDNQYEVGSRLPNTPEHAASLWTSYEIQSGELRGLGVGLGLFFQGERQGNLTNTYTLPGFLRTDAAVFYRRDRFRASLNLQNLFDVTYFEGSRDNTDVRVVVGTPFTFSGQISWEF
jgi:iron complex outermembrane recepter protein